MLARVRSLAGAAVRGEIRLVNYFLVGGLNTLFGYGVFALCLRIDLHYSLAIAISTVLGTLFNFKSTGKLVFRSSDNSRIVHFVLVYGVVYLVNVAAVAVLVRLGLNAYLSGLVLIVPLALLAYHLNSRFVFNRNEHE
ncbi:polysaccharide biosynthesis protein GtrA [Pandoraea cepalis]|uniref:Polysaccharide biosynthesis protein GtrA n=1 Tax=Pandoraea cepalis TaxID=2508294 RepID=A0AAW7MQD5_9BURK|nr:GtrA family protein [Pandoraea cepalis]MDN4574778.1 polysaccharide biosynthesis protein GtrA [Pandoraea cepalis]MDN4580281.1 polysaccharide biosynthesis protein GtrA [Pandoraea cepalis]